jgi:hypothetical protein
MMGYFKCAFLGECLRNNFASLGELNDRTILFLL